MSTESNKDVVRQYTEAVDAEAPSAIRQYLAEDFGGHMPGAPGPLDREGFAQFAAAFYSAFPGLRNIIEDPLAEGIV